MSSPATLPMAPPLARSAPGRRLAACGLVLAVLLGHGAWLAGHMPQAPRATAPAMATAPVWRVSLRAPAEAAPQPPRAAAPPAGALAGPADGPPARPLQRAAPPAADALPTRPLPDAPAQAEPPAAGLPQPPAAARGEPADSGSASPPPVPLYATQLPPAQTLVYRLQRGSEQATARLVWAREGEAYSLQLAAEGSPGSPLQGLGAASRGQVDAHGLAPERFVSRRRGRDRAAASFDPARGEILLSTRAEPAPWQAGTQDRVSWMLQLAGVLQANPALARPGQRVLLPVAAARGDPQVWRFEVLPADATLAGLPPPPAEPPPALLHLRHTAERPHGLQVDVWVDPARHHLPWRVLLSAPPGPWASDMVLAKPAAAAGSTTPAPARP